MNKQSVVAVVTVLGLAGCGGGGSSGDNTNRAGATTNTQISASALLGTWVQTNVNYVGLNGQQDWIKTRRQTIIVEQVGGVFRFRDCNSGTILNASLASNKVTFPAQPGLSLDVVDANTITTVVTQGSTRTEVALHKVSSNTQAVVAGVDVSVDIDGQQLVRSEWNQVCVHTIIDKYATDIIELKAVGSENGITGTVALKFQTSGYFIPDEYMYPTLGNDVTGSYSVTLLGSGNLSNPVGSMVLTENSTTDLYFGLLMANTSSQAPQVGLVGEINLDPEWLSVE